MNNDEFCRSMKKYNRPALSTPVRPRRDRDEPLSIQDVSHVHSQVPTDERRLATATRRRAHCAALDRSMARVEFDPDGNITDANENFLTLLGYRRDEILGKPHRQLCDGAYAQSEDYRRWERLRRGEHFSGRCKLLPARPPLWLEATYNPVRDGQGRLLKVVKYASDIDAIVHQEHEMQSKLDALSRSMAMIEFDLDGNVLAANDNFLATMGYGRAELAAPATASSANRATATARSTPTSGAA